MRGAAGGPTRQDTQLPEAARVPTHLGRQVLRCPTEGLHGGPVTDALLAQAKVRDLDVAVLIQHEVFQLWEVRVLGVPASWPEGGSCGCTPPGAKPSPTKAWGGQTLPFPGPDPGSFPHCGVQFFQVTTEDTILAPFFSYTSYVVTHTSGKSLEKT